MPWVVREAVRDINRAVGRRWQAIDPLLPDPAALPAGCGEPLVVNGDNGRMAGLGVCVHQHVPPQSLNQTWGAADRFTLVPRLPGQDVAAAADLLLAQWRDHLAAVGADPRARTRRRAWSGRAWTSPACRRAAAARPAAADRDRRPRPAERPAAPPPRRRLRRHDPRRGPGRRGAGARPGAAAHPLRHALRRPGVAAGHRPAGPRRDPRQPRPPGHLDLAGRAERPRGRPAGRPAAAGRGLDRRA